MEISLKQIAEILNGSIEGNDELMVNRLEKIEEASEGSIAFLANPKYTEYLYSTQASAVIVNNDFKPTKAHQTNLIRVEDAYSAFAQLLEAYQQMTKIEKSGIEQPSFQHETSSLGEQIYLGAFSYVGQESKIGNGTKIYPHAFIGDRVTIGENSVIHSGVKIYANCHVGSNCIIHAGAVIGSDGFGYAPQEDGTYKNVPQTGNVIIEDHVDIGANTTIDCATMGSTIVRAGVKVDNLVQIAHNVEVGRNTAIASQAGLSGSAKIGENCQIGGQAGITGHLHMANKTIIGPQAGVPKSIKEEGKVWFGTPIMEHREFLRTSVILRNLPQVIERLKALEKKS